MFKKVALSLALVFGVPTLPTVGFAEADGDDPNVPVFQKEVFAKNHDSAAIDQIEFDVNKTIRYFKVDINSVYPHECEAKVKRVFANGRGLFYYRNSWYLFRKANVSKAAIRYYVPNNHGYCSFIVKAYE